jgi:hypothetical protein
MNEAHRPSLEEDFTNDVNDWGGPATRIAVAALSMFPDDSIQAQLGT